MLSEGDLFQAGGREAYLPGYGRVGWQVTHSVPDVPVLVTHTMNVQRGLVVSYYEPARFALEMCETGVKGRTHLE